MKGDLSINEVRNGIGLSLTVNDVPKKKWLNQVFLISDQKFIQTSNQSRWSIMSTGVSVNSSVVLVAWVSGLIDSFICFQFSMKNKQLKGRNTTAYYVADKVL